MPQEVLTAEEMSNSGDSCSSDFWQAALKAAVDMLGKLAICEQLQQFGHWSKWQHLQGAALHLQPVHCHPLLASKLQTCLCSSPIDIVHTSCRHATCAAMPC